MYSFAPIQYVSMNVNCLANRGDKVNVKDTIGKKHREREREGVKCGAWEYNHLSKDRVKKNDGYWRLGNRQVVDGMLQIWKVLWTYHEATIKAITSNKFTCCTRILCANECTPIPIIVSSIGKLTEIFVDATVKPFIVNYLLETYVYCAFFPISKPTEMFLL